MTVIFPSSWRSPAAGVRLSSRSICSALSSTQSEPVFSSTRGNAGGLVGYESPSQFSPSTAAVWRSPQRDVKAHAIEPSIPPQRYDWIAFEMDKFTSATGEKKRLWMVILMLVLARAAPIFCSMRLSFAQIVHWWLLFRESEPLLIASSSCGHLYVVGSLRSPFASYCWKALIALYENSTPFYVSIGRGRGGDGPY